MMDLRACAAERQSSAAAKGGPLQRRDVGEDQVVPAEQRHQPVGGGEVAAGLPFGG